MNVPSVSVGRADSARRFVRLKLIFAAALLKPPYRALGFVLHKPARLASMNVPSVSVGRAEPARRFVRLKLIVAAALLKPPYRCLGIVQLNSAFYINLPLADSKPYRLRRRRKKMPKSL